MLTARDIMQAEPRSVSPDTTLPDLQEALLSAGMSGFPVVQDGRLIGVVSRSDVVRHLTVERSLGEMLSDYQREAGSESGDEAFLDRVAQHVGSRMEKLRVADVMTRSVLSLPPEAPLQLVARTIVDNRIHRLLVVEGERLLGLISSTDLVRLVAEGRLEAPETRSAR
jgi:CBS domain-containing protein